MKNSDETTRITVKVTPGAKRNSVSAFKDGVWCIKIAAPPVEGKANEELIAYLSRAFDIRKSAIEMLKGHTGRSKTLAILGLSLAEINRRLRSELKPGN